MEIILRLSDEGSNPCHHLLVLVKSALLQAMHKKLSPIDAVQISHVTIM